MRPAIASQPPGTNGHSKLISSTAACVIAHNCMLHLQVDPKERFSSEHKLLTLDLDLPLELLQRSGPPADMGDLDLTLDDITGHLDLVRHQYIQARHRYRTHQEISISNIIIYVSKYITSGRSLASVRGSTGLLSCNVLDRGTLAI